MDAAPAILPIDAAMDPTQAPPEAEAPAAEDAVEWVPGWQRLAFAACVVAIIGPPVWAVGAIFIRTAGNSWFSVPVLVAAVVAAWVAKRQDDRVVTTGQAPLLRAGIAAVVSVTLVAMAAQAGAKVRRSSQYKSIIGPLRQLSAGAEQYFVENPDRVFVNFDDVVGPQNYVKAVSTVMGEDYRTLFPVRRDDTDLFVGGPLMLPGGVVYPGIKPRPVQPDGIEFKQLDDGTHFETTWRSGVRHGPFYAYRANGALWCVARYENGRAVEIEYLRNTGWQLGGPRPPPGRR